MASGHEPSQAFLKTKDIIAWKCNLGQDNILYNHDLHVLLQIGGYECGKLNEGPRSQRTCALLCEYCPISYLKANSSNMKAPTELWVSYCRQTISLIKGHRPTILDLFLMTLIKHV